MSFNQSKSDKSELHYRKTGRSTRFNRKRTTSGANGKGAGGLPAPSPPPSSNRSFKKSINVQGGQSKVTSPAVNSSNAPSVSNVQNGPHVQPPIHANASPAVSPLESATSQRSTRAVPKAPTSQPATVSSDRTFPTTPSKASGDASKAFSVQFGSKSPGFMNGMQVSVRTSSAPPNLDEQKPAQARHDSSFRYVPKMPTPVPKQQQPRKDSVSTVQSDSGEAHPMPKVNKDAQAFVASPTKQTEKPSHPMPMPFHKQQQVSMQLGGPNPQFQSPASIQLPIHMPLPMGNAPLVQQQVLVPGLQAHPLPPQGMMHQGQSLNFLPPIGGQLPLHLGNMGMGIAPRYPQRQRGKFGVPRKTTTVKITHPDTHEELRLDKRAYSYSDGAPSGPGSHPNVLSQSQPIPSFGPSHSINYYSKSMFYPPPSSLPFSSSQIAPTAQGPRFNYPVSHSHQNISFMNSAAAHGSVPGNKSVNIVHFTSESPNSLPAVEKVRKNKKEKREKKENFKDLDACQSRHENAIESEKIIQKERKEKNTTRGQDLSEPTSKYERGQVPSSKDKPVPELSRTKSNTTRGKKKRKEFLRNANTAGTSSDLYMAYKGPEEKKGTVTSAKSNSVGLDLKHTSCGSPHKDDIESEKNGQNKAIPDDWEDSADISALNLGTLESDEKAHGVLVYHEKDGSGNIAKKYSRDFLLKFAEKCTDLPYGFEIDTNFVKIFMIAPDFVKTFTIAVEKVRKYKKKNKKSKNFKDLDACQSRHENAIESEKNAQNKAIPDDWEDSADISILNHGTLETDACQSRHENAIESEKNAQNKAIPDDWEDSADISILNLGNLETDEKVHGTLESDEKAHGVLVYHEKDGSGNIAKKYSRDFLLKFAEKCTDLPYGFEIDTNFVKIFMIDPDFVKTFTIAVEKVRKYKKKNKKSKTFKDLDACQSRHENAIDSEKIIQNKVVPDDWEDSADISILNLGNLETDEKAHGVFVNHEKDGSGNIAKKYSRDFLKFAEKCTDLPHGFEIDPDFVETFMITTTNFNASHFVGRDSHNSPGRILDRQFSGSRQEFCASGMVGDDRWSTQPGSFGSGRDPCLDLGSGAAAGFRPAQGGDFGVLRHPRGQAPLAYIGGILGSPMQPMGPQGGIPCNSLDSNRWQRATIYQQMGLLPSPQTPLQMMHKAERKCEVCIAAGEDEFKQRQLKAILNKLTPQNFEKLFEQVKAVNIDNAVTLNGVISQIFDKALMEPTFCEMYAKFCYHLAELPYFSEDNEKITFKKLLLNKCQEEFERGEREQEEANKIEEEGEVKQSEEEREEKRIKARRRMLGNIRLIGELYKKKMLAA